MKWLKNNFKITPFFKQCFVTTAVCITIMGQGSMGGFIAILLPQLAEPNSYINYTEEIGSWIASVTGISAVIGGLLISPIMGRLGRKVAHLSVTSSLLIGWIIIIFARNAETIIVGRFIQGMSYGMTLPLHSVIIGECTSPKYRGAFLTTMSVAQSLGILLIHLIGSLIPWQKSAFVLLTFPLASFLMALYIPETPSWLADKGKYDQCRKVFRWFRGDEEREELEDMIAAISDKENKQAIATFGDIFTIIKKREFYKPLLIMIHCYIMVQFSGGMIMVFYFTTVITMIAGPDVDPNFWMVELGIQRLISNLLAVIVVNKFRRKPFIFSTSILCILSNVAIACYAYFRHFGGSNATWIPLLLINIQYFTVAVGMLCFPFIIAGEIFPLEYRSVAGSISMVFSSSAFFLLTKTFLALVGAVDVYGAFGIYAGILCYCSVVLWAFLPETKGKTLQEIEDYFRGKK